MIETNSRIVQPGINLYILTRCVKITTMNSSAETMEKVCNQFASRGFAAVYCPERKQIVVLTRGTISPFEVKRDNLFVRVEDGGKDQKIQFSRSENDASLLAQLIERHVQIEIKRRLKLHTFDSPRIFQDTKPFKTVEDIDVYRRFEVSALPIQGVGVGISVDISTAFFTYKTVAEIFRNDISIDEQQRLQEDFRSLSQRQRGQKGTLLYDLENKQRKCYFSEFLHGVTCATTAPLSVNGQNFSSLFEYYQHKHPHLKINPNDSVAMVSFKGINQPRPVAAKLLRLRVMNDSLPGLLKQVDKLAPKERRKLIVDFWDRLGSDLLGRGRPSVARYFWCPEEKQIINLLPPALQFASGVILPSPQAREYAGFQKHYRQRLEMLRKVGCLYVPPSIERTVHFAIPKKVMPEIRKSLITDIVQSLSRLTGKPIAPEIVVYDRLNEVFLKINQHNMPGIVVFVFDNEDPETYFRVSHELPNWRIKRITFRELCSKFGRIKSKVNNRGWNSFIEMSILDVLQQMDCIPWGLKNEPPYDAHLAIDVGRNKRDFALSLLTFHPYLRIRTVVKQKIDSRHETINEVILYEEIVKLFKNEAERSDFQAPASLLVLRDGRECGQELEGINKAKEKLIEKRLLVESAQGDVVDFHKNIAKNHRFWEKIKGNVVQQILEGTAVVLDNRTVVLPTTGFPTLHQGTADPVMLLGRSDNIDMNRVTESVFASTHLNFSNPNVAQKLPLELKRTDDELKNRDSQEIRRIK